MKRCPKCGSQTFRVTTENMSVEVYYDGDGRVRKVEACEDNTPPSWDFTKITCEGIYLLRPDGSKTEPCNMEFKSWEEIPESEDKKE